MLKILTSGAALAAVGLACTLAINFVMAHSGGAAELGIYAESLAWHVVLATIGTFGSDRLAIRELPRHKNRDHVLQIVVHLYKRTLLASTLLSMLASAIWLFSHHLLNPQEGTLLAVACATAPLSSTVTLMIGTLNGMQRPAIAQFHEQMIRPVLALAMAVGWASTLALSASALFTIYLASTLVVIASAGWAISRQLGRLEATEGKGLTPATLQQLASPGKTLTLAVATNVLTSRADILILGAVASPVTVGIYHVASRIAALSNTLQSILSTVIAPKAARLMQDNDIAALQSAVQSAVWMAFGLALPWFVLVTAFASDILGLLGREYASGSTILHILLVGSVFNLATGPAGTLLSCARLDKDLLIATVSGLLSMSAGIVALAPSWGASGCAVGTTLGIVVCNLYAVIQLRRKIRIDCTIMPRFRLPFSI